MISFSATEGSYFRYQYDLWNRLSAVYRSEAGTDAATAPVSTYRYDPNGLRILKTTADTETLYPYGVDGTLLEETRMVMADPSQTVRLDFVHAFGTILAWQEHSETITRRYWAISDHLGSVSGASDESGTLVMRQDYDAFGNPHDALLPGLTGPRFTGKDWDEEAGLCYFNARWYDPELGRFITEDPIRDGVNWYGYVNNRPLNLVDPSGLAVLDENGDFEVGGGRKPKKPIPEVNPVIEEEVRERKAEEDKRREEDHTRRKYGEPTTSELAAGYGFTASQGQIYLDSLQRYKDYFGKEGVSFSEIEALYWMYLDTQDPVFSDALMNNHASPLLEGALEAATDIYYSENPIEAALEHSERLAFAGYLGMAIGQQYIAASSERSRARALAAGLAAVEYEPGTPFAAGSGVKVRGMPPDGVRPPVAGGVKAGPASRPSEQVKGGQSLWDQNGGEWRYFPEDNYHNPHWDYNSHASPNSPWINIQIGNLPPRK
ncbi:MAG: RHS repeat-associated core domain-containing protein [Spirochaetia bacterium]|nr:RHS repeat-associated core domain-containing protein [Spirochaetia bacterium]